MRTYNPVAVTINKIVVGGADPDKFIDAMAKSFRPGEYRADVHKLVPIDWLRWFLHNHPQQPLIDAGLWKRPNLVVRDVGEDLAAACQAAYHLDGASAVWPLIIDALRVRDVAQPARPVYDDETVPAADADPRVAGFRGIDRSTAKTKPAAYGDPSTRRFGVWRKDE